VSAFCARQHICCKCAYAIAIPSVCPSVCLSVTRILTISWKFAVDFFARGLHSRTAVARLPLRQLGFLVTFMQYLYNYMYLFVTLYYRRSALSANTVRLMLSECDRFGCQYSVRFNATKSKSMLFVAKGFLY